MDGTLADPDDSLFIVNYIKFHLMKFYVYLSQTTMNLILDSAPSRKNNSYYMNISFNGFLLEYFLMVFDVYEDCCCGFDHDNQNKPVEQK
jgi:hypothetical protein